MIKTIIMFILSISLGVYSYSLLVPHPSGRLINFPSEEYTNLVLNCNDPALKYMNCDNYNPNLYSYKEMNVVVMDVGLTTQQWNWLINSKNPLKVNSLTYITSYPSGNPSSGNSVYNIFTKPGGHVSPNFDSTHSVGIISAMTTITREFNLFFIDMKMASNDVDGYDLTESDALKWILNNYDKYRFDVVLFAGSGKSTFGGTDQPNIMSELLDHNMFLVSSSGNKNTQFNYDASISNDTRFYHPQFLKEWYGVGSISHEDRGLESDLDYFSSIGSRSGSEKCFQVQILECEGIEIWGSSWGTEDELDYEVNGSGNDFSMPGHGVPVYYDSSHFRYHSGTSYSAAYLAAVALISIQRYVDGYQFSTGVSKRPSVSDVFDILKSSSSRKDLNWDHALGWGVLDVVQVFQNAFKVGIEE